jgi:hypothetical protein
MFTSSYAFNNKPSHLFTENKGQLTDQNQNNRNDILFYGTMNDRHFFLRGNGISYEIRKPIAWDSLTKSNFSVHKISGIKSVSKWSSHRVDINWMGINSNIQIEKQDQSEDYDNFYLPSCPDGAIHVRSYGALLYKNIYDGIDLRYYESKGKIKYDYIVKPYYDHTKIKFQINGASKLYINSSGQLVMVTANGSIIEDAPIVKQSGKTLKAKWKLSGNVVSFTINGRDPAKEMIIDPLVRFWGTFYGGSNSDVSQDCETDSIGNIYMVGHTKSTNQIATVGSFQSTITNVTDFDGFLVKFNSNGVRQWGTYYGSYGLDGFMKVGIHKGNIVYAVGFADYNSASGIATTGAFQPTYGGGDMDAFAVRFNSSGIRDWCTFYGGEGKDAGISMVVGSGAEVYIYGQTSSTTNLSIATIGSHQATLSGTQDTFLAKLDSTGQRIWGTYYGGSFSEQEEECAIDKWDNVFITGVTTSPNNISTPGVHQPTLSGGGNNAFLIKFNSAGVRMWGTYYGGNSGMGGLGCTTDLSGNSYITGATSSTVGVATPGSHQTSFVGSHENAYLVKFNPNGQRLWGTYYGASKVTVGRSVCTDKDKNVYLEGHTTSVNCGDTIATSNGFQTNNNSIGFAYDSFIAKFDSTGLRKMGTFYGGPGYEIDGDVEVDNNGFIFLTGTTTSPTGTYIATPAAHQYSTTVGDAFLVKFFDCGAQVSADITSLNNGCFGQNNASVTITPNGGGLYTYTWMPSGGNSNVATNLAPGVYTCYINSVCGNTTQTVSIVQPLAAVGSNTLGSDTTICIGNSGTLTINASGGSAPYSYSWSNGSTVNVIVVSPSVSTTYTCLVTDANNCSYSDTVVLKVDQCVGLKEIRGDQNNFSLHPNPSSGKFTIYGNLKKLPSEIEIIDVRGRVIRKLQFESQEIQIDLSENTNGLYFVKIIREGRLIASFKMAKNT